jgi:hypothetical protein
MSDFTQAAEAQAFEKDLLKANSLDEQSFKEKLDALAAAYQTAVVGQQSTGAVSTLPAGTPSAQTTTSHYGQWLLFLRSYGQSYTTAYIRAATLGSTARVQDVRTSLYAALSQLPEEYADVTWKRICEIGREATQPASGPRPAASGTFIAAESHDWAAGAGDQDPGSPSGSGAAEGIVWEPGYEGYITAYEMRLADAGNLRMQKDAIARYEVIGDEQTVASLRARWGYESVVEDDTATGLVRLAIPLGAAFLATR